MHSIKVLMYTSADHAVLLLGRTASPKVFHPEAILSHSFKAVMSGLLELDVSEPVLGPKGSVNIWADSPALLGSILEAAPSLRRLSACGWGKGSPGAASALAQTLALHPVSLHSLSVGHARPLAAVSPCELPVSSCRAMEWCLSTTEGITSAAAAHILYKAGVLTLTQTLSARLNVLYACIHR